MLNDVKYSSDDSSDDEYVPSDHGASEASASSGDEDVDDVEEDQVDSNNIPSKKTLHRKLKGGKIITLVSNKEASPELEEDNEERVESLWSSFKEEVKSKPAQSFSQKPNDQPIVQAESTSSSTLKVAAATSSSTASKPLDNKRPIKVGGLSSFTSNLSAKKQKVGILEKSKLDWQDFKQKEGIEEDLKTFNQGKHGFLERKSFLERTDLKQFEIEKNLRAGRKTEH